MLHIIRGKARRFKLVVRVGSGRGTLAATKNVRWGTVQCPCKFVST